MGLGSCRRRVLVVEFLTVVTLTARKVSVAGFHATHHCIDSAESWTSSKDWRAINTGRL